MLSGAFSCPVSHLALSRDALFSYPVCVGPRPMRQDFFFPEVSGLEARQFFPQVIGRVRGHLQQQNVPRNALPFGAGTYGRRLAAADETVSAALWLRLALFQSAPPALRERAQAACAPHTRRLRPVLWPLIAEYSFSERHYCRGMREWRACAQTVQAAVLECVACDVQLARAVLEVSEERMRDPDAFLAHLVQMALTDSLGYQGREDRCQNMEVLCDSADWERIASDPAHSTPSGSTPEPSLENVPDLLLKYFVRQFPVAGVTLGPERAAEAQALYLRGMLLCGEQGARNGWGHQRFPRGYLTETVAPALGLPLHQERRLRRAFEEALEELRSLRRAALL